MLKFILPTEQNKIEVLSFYGEIENNGGIFEDRRYFSDENVFVKPFGSIYNSNYGLVRNKK